MRIAAFLALRQFRDDRDAGLRAAAARHVSPHAGASIRSFAFPNTLRAPAG